MSAFHFEDIHHTIKGTKVYQIVNDETRILPFGNDSRLKAGTRGGYVECPELLGPVRDLWIARNGLVLGHTTIEGRCVIRRATVSDSCIRGNVRIGDLWERTLSLDDTERLAPKRLYVRGCTIDASGDPSAQGTAQREYLEISGRIYMFNSHVYGSSVISGLARVITSDIRDSTVCEQAFVSGSIVQYHSRICGSANVNGSRIITSTVDKSATITRSEVRNRRITGETFLCDNALWA